MGHFMLSSELPFRASYVGVGVDGKVGYVQLLARCSSRRNGGLFDRPFVDEAFNHAGPRRRWRAFDQLIRLGYVLAELDGTYSLPISDDEHPGQWLTVLAMDGRHDPVAKIANPAYAGRMPIPAGVRESVMRRDRMICGLCGGAVPRNDVHIDHIVPWSKGGSDDAGNLQVTHSICNMRKGNRV